MGGGQKKKLTREVVECEGGDAGDFSLREGARRSVEGLGPGRGVDEVDGVL